MSSETSNKTHKFHVLTDEKVIEADDNIALIDLCENHDTSILYGCRDGACGACMIRVVEGSENLSPMEDHERDFLETMAAEPNERLACQCRIRGDVKVEVSD